MVEPGNASVSVARQCELLGLNRSTLYYRERPPTGEDIELMRRLDGQYTETPFYGYRRMTVWLRSAGYAVNHKRVSRLMKVLGLEAIYPKPNLSRPNKEHLIYPYLLRGVEITQSDKVWATDITYIRMGGGFIYLLVIIDWHSRYVIDFEVSNTLESSAFVRCLKRAIQTGKPEIFNSDQGSQFSSIEWIKVLVAGGIQISMDGKGRCFDNIFVERLWRTVKQEEVYLNEYQDVWQADDCLRKYFEFFNHRRPHQSLGYKTPAEIYRSGKKSIAANKSYGNAALMENSEQFSTIAWKSPKPLFHIPTAPATG